MIYLGNQQVGIVQEIRDMSSIAATFDSTVNYNVGDYVSYGDTLYKFTTAHTVGTWNAEHVTEVTVGEELTGLQTQMVQDVQVNGTSVVSNGVANIPVATSNNVLGLVKPNTGYGIGVLSDGTIGIVAASNNDIKAGSGNSTAVTPGREHAAAFYGLAKAAGDSTQSASSSTVGNYTDAAKSAISRMLNGSVAVTGTTPTITALPGIRYVCGEVATLNITLPVSGIVDVVFESGSTPTVLTVTPPTGVTVKWANGFDPTALDANTTYEINIADGLGVSASWT